VRWRHAARREATADHHVEVALAEVSQQLADLLGRMLTVAVHLDDDVRSRFRCVPEAGAQGATDSEVDRQPDHDGAGLFGEVGRAVGAGVVDHHAVVAERGDRLHHLADARFLFEGRHHGDDFGHVVCSSS